MDTLTKKRKLLTDEEKQQKNKDRYNRWYAKQSDEYKRTNSQKIISNAKKRKEQSELVKKTPINIDQSNQLDQLDQLDPDIAFFSDLATQFDKDLKKAEMNKKHRNYYKLRINSMSDTEKEEKNRKRTEKRKNKKIQSYLNTTVGLGKKTSRKKKRK